jgi:hypothetical protein
LEEEIAMRVALLISALAVLASDAGWAQTASERAACQADFQKFCKGVEPGGGRVIQCLAEHMSELTPECQKVVKAHSPG